MAIASAALAIGLVATILAVPAQERPTAAVKDVIVARKTLMNSIMDNVDKITEMISQRKIDLHAAHGHAENISAMLTAFPHLFPPSSNLWRDNADLDPVTDTIASPDVWTDFADFYRRAVAAADTASELGRADNADDLRRLFRALGVACDTCHALYLKEQ